MASWTALNVYPDSDSEGEVDNTEELQTEEALKLYQRALKLHTDGAWDEANRAYTELFQSEIFQLDPDLDEQIDGSTRTAVSSLKLLFYLAYKNHGAFKLDQLRATPSLRNDESTQLATMQALDWFATALGRDSGDPSLWRETTQLCLNIRSARAARFSLESILDHDTVGVDSANDTLALVSGSSQNPMEYVASFQLRDLLEAISDTATLSKEPFKKLAGKKINVRLKNFTNPYPWLPALENIPPLATSLEACSEKRNSLIVPSRSWPAVGRAILSVLTSDEEDAPASNTLQFTIPPLDEDDTSGPTSPEEMATPAEGKSETAIADDDTAMTDASAAVSADPNRRGSGSSARKRKSASLGADVTDTGRSRLSKRQRDKKDADAAAASGTTVENKQKVKQETQDEKLFNTAYECFSPLGLSLGTASSLKMYTATGDVRSADDGVASKDDLHLRDFQKILQGWDDDKGNVIIYGDGIQSVAEAAQGMAYLDLETNIPSRTVLVGDEGLGGWTRGINARQLSAEAAGLEWIKALCMRSYGPPPRNKKSVNIVGSSTQGGWVRYNWPDNLKATVLDMARECEGFAWRFFKQYEETVRSRRANSQNAGDEEYATTEWAQTMLEIYLEDFAFAERLRSGADLGEEFEDEVATKRERAQRWSYLVGDLIHHRPRNEDGQIIQDQLTLRHLWARAVFTGFNDTSREIRLEVFEDLKLLLSGKDLQPIELPNCTVMPEISVARADREISKLKTVDFFNHIFQTAPSADGRPSERVIETLEAVLKPGDILPYDEDEGRALEDIGRFLEGSSAMFKLHLWEKLKTAYEQVNDPPEVLSCTLKCIQVIMDDLKSRSYVESSEDHRHFILLRSLKQVEELLLDVLGHIITSPRILQELQNDEVQEALATSMGLLRLLHCYTFWEDAVMNTEATASDLHSYRLVVVKLREMLVKSWVVVYHLYSEALRRGMGSDRDTGWTEEEKTEKLGLLLRDLHDELGARHYCKLANHLFLELLFDELLKFDNPEFHADLLQCIHCRFHLMLCSDQIYFYEHKTNPESLTKPSAMRILDLVLLLASRKKISQLPKSDLKVGLDRLVEVLGSPRNEENPRVAHNSTIIEQYFKTSIHPLRLSGCLKGELNLSTVSVGGEYGIIAEKGLYSLQGKIALYPLRQPKKVGPIKGDDITTAMGYFKFDLVCRPDNWETWYRVGQTFEVQIEENQTWNADQINTKRSILVTLERNAVLSYMMSVSLAMQSSDDSAQTTKTFSELCTDFGYRVYSASRPPMAMESFWVDGFERHYSGRHGEGMYKARPHGELTLNSALKFSLLMFEYALKGGENNWKNHYMLGKCMGKLHRKAGLYSVEDVLQKYVDAIRHCPDKNGNEYIFEPHHKLISSACKYVLNEEIEPGRACEILQASHFTKGREVPETVEQYVAYTIDVLKKMKHADKPKWHHRMTYRVARLKFEQLGDVAGARAEFASLFSNKAAQLSIWKPEFERPGRHFVFASHYTMFYVDLLGKLNDRPTLEILAKRVRRLSNGLFRHPEVWSHVFATYIGVLRTTGNVPSDNEDDVFKNISYDEFTNHSQRLENYCCRQEAKLPTLDLLQEIYELRRLNAGLAKTPFPLIDDLLADTYAKLYAELVPQLAKQKAQQDTAAATNPMSVKNLMDNPPADGGAVPSVTMQLDDLPLRGKLTKVTRRELVSKAASLCKELTAVPAKITVIAPTAAPTVPTVSAQPRKKHSLPNSTENLADSLQRELGCESSGNKAAVRKHRKTRSSL